MKSENCPIPKCPMINTLTFAPSLKEVLRHRLDCLWMTSQITALTIGAPTQESPLLLSPNSPYWISLTFWTPHRQNSTMSASRSTSWVMCRGLEPTQHTGQHLHVFIKSIWHLHHHTSPEFTVTPSFTVSSICTQMIRACCKACRTTPSSVILAAAISRCHWTSNVVW